jgi:competence protein ComEC
MLLLDETAGGDAPGMLRRLGFVHLLSASGIHLYALSDLASLALRPGLKRVGLSALMGVRIARALSGSLWLFCWALAGGRPGMLRPLLLLGLKKSSEAAGFRWRSYASLLAALAIDLIAGLARGEASTRALGYGLAVGGGVASLQMLRERGKPGFRAAIALSVGSWIFLALLEAWQGGTVALGTPLLSLLTLPVLSLTAYPLLTLAALARAAGLTALSSGIAGEVSTGVTWITSLLAQATMTVPTLWVLPPAPLLFGLALGAPLTIAGGIWARAGLGLLGVSVALRLLLAPEGGLPAREVRQLAVGQGDSALIVGSEAGLIDVGSERAVPDSRWIGLLARSGVTRLDWVALTHLDEDHAGGLHSLLRLLPVGCVESARAQWETRRGRELALLLSKNGTNTRLWGAGCVPFPTLAPPEARPGERSANSAMGAVWVPLEGGSSYLSAGDATAEDEPRIGAWARALSDHWGRGERILKVSHHGSKTSSAPAFLAAFAPDELWISVGRGNLYGHPDPGVLSRLEKLGVPVLRTDLEGELRAGAGHPRNDPPRAAAAHHPR